MLPDDGSHDVGLALIRRRVLTLHEPGVPGPVSGEVTGAHRREVPRAHRTHRRPSSLRAASLLDVFHPVRHGRREAGRELPVALHPEHLVRVSRAPVSVGFVPRPRGGGVVTRRGAHGCVGVPVRSAKLTLVVGHALDAQAQDAELVQHGRDARWDHAQVLAAHELTGARHQRGQRAPRVFPPERILPGAEIVVVEPVEGILRPALELVERGRLLHLYARVERVWVLGVPQQTHVVLQVEKTLSHSLRLLDEPIRRAVPNLKRVRAQQTLLRAELGLEPVRVDRAAVG